MQPLIPVRDKHDEARLPQPLILYYTAVTTVIQQLQGLPVREEHDEDRLPQPLLLPRRNELVDDHLVYSRYNRYSAVTTVIQQSQPSYSRYTLHTLKYVKCICSRVCKVYDGKVYRKVYLLPSM